MNAKDLKRIGVSIGLAGMVLGTFGGPVIGHLAWVDALALGATVAVVGFVTLALTSLAEGAFTTCQDCSQSGPFDRAIAGAGMGFVGLIIRCAVIAALFWTLVGAATFAHDGRPVVACGALAIAMAMGSGLLLGMGMEKAA